ncbi:splicing factor ESS-2 homolog [Tetranychus urticae]|uniref:Uncharacterized protein n=1 Tax=Tetranychus urticae TaxID=32264 RepID=T1JTW3_TETUR|nr:splicing factor ESS-2 homolog [Tetranychus urticae]
MALIKKDNNSSLISSSTSSSSLVPAEKKRKPIVLEEDEFIEALDCIIERDFYPALSKMKQQLKILDNPLVQGQAATLSAPLTATPLTFETPNITIPVEEVNERDDTTEDTIEPSKKKIKTNLSLNAFLSKYTSEDNASFDDIMKEAEKRHRQKYPWLYLEEEKMNQMITDGMTLPSIEGQDMIGADGTVGRIAWAYKNLNSLMFIPEGVKDGTQFAPNPHSTICHENTRFKKNPFNENLSESVLAEAALVASQEKTGKIGIDGKELINNVPKVGGYSFVPLTPSPAPGVTNTPLMTWGQIEGTPYSLDGSETPLLTSSSLPSGTPQFRIPDVPKREQIGHALADKINKTNRNKKKEAYKQAQYLKNSPLIYSGGKTFNESLGSMSPAAQKLATLRLGINKNVDKELRCSYSPSISRTPNNRLKSPITPSPSSLMKVTTPKPTSNISLTDNLLNIPRKIGKS